jgi:hypothetical protein
VKQLFLICALTLFTLLFFLSCSTSTKPDKVATPVLTPPGGTYSQDQVVSISTTTDGAEIRYTLDGSIPPANSIIYTAPVDVPLGTTVKAYAIKAGMKDSNVVSAFYSGTVPTPEITPVSGTYLPDTYIRISIDGLTSASSWPEGTSVRYTLDGTEPDTTSLLYEFPFQLGDPCTIKARAYRYNWTPSPIVSQTYDVYPTLDIAGSCVTNGDALSMDIIGHYMYVADEGYGLSILDLSNPTAPLLAGSVMTKNSAMFVETTGNYIYLGDAYFGIWVFDAYKPTDPYYIGTIPVTGTLTAMTLSGNYLYAANTTGALVIYDIIKPEAPFAVGTVYLPGIATGMEVSGNYLYAAAGKNGLAVVDVTSHSNPQNVATCIAPGDAKDVSIQGDYAYLTYTVAGLQVINISNPLAPFNAGTLTAPSDTWFVSAPGYGYAYVTGDNFDLLKVDVSNPDQPVILASCSSQGTFHRIKFYNGYMYVANYSNGVLVIEP